MAITEDVITATTQLSVTDGPGGPVFADLVPTAGKAYLMGKLGIGTINPQNALDVEGALAVGAAYSGGAVAPANGLLVEGNVGIGTNAPGAKLDVNGGAFLGYETSVADLGGVLKSGFYQNTGTKVIGDVPDAGHSWTHLIAARHNNTANNHQLQIAASYATNDKLYFRKIAAGTPAASNPTWNEIATRGPNAFVGDQSVQGALNVSGNVTAAGALIAGRSDIYFTDTSHNHTGTGNTAGHAAIENAGNYDALMILGRAGTAKGRKVRLWDYLSVEGSLEVNGDVVLQAGKQLTSPGRMHIHGEELLYLLNKSGVIVSKAWQGNGDLTVEGNLKVEGNTTVQGHWVTVHGAGGERACLGGDGSGGDVQVGTFNPGVSTVSFWNGGNGTWMDARAKYYHHSSDARLKTNIEPVHGALEKVLQLSAVKFDWADQAGKGSEGRRIGLLAQQVLAVVPEAVSQDAKGMYYISDAPLVSILIEAVKEQNARLERLEAGPQVRA